MHVVIKEADDANINRLLQLRGMVDKQLRELWADFLQRKPIDHEKMNTLECEAYKLERAAVVLTCITTEVVL